MATQSKHDVTAGVLVAHSKLKENRRQTEWTQRTTRGESMERMHRLRQAIDAHKLADETEFSAGILNVPSYRNDDINDARTKSTIAQKSGASTPGNAGAARDRSNGSGEATPSISLLRQQPQRYLGTVFETVGGTSATRCADLSAVTPMPIKGSSNAATAFLGSGLFSTRTSQAGASSPAVQALGGLRRVRSTSSTAGGASSAAYGLKELGPENTGVPGTSHVANAAIALVRASEVLRSNWRSMEGPKRSDSEASEREQQERQEDVGRNGGKRKAKRPASAVLGVRQRVAAAAPMALASAMSSGGGGATEGPAHKRQQRLRSPQITLAGAGRDWEEWEAVGYGGGVYRQVNNISEGGAKWRARRDDVPMARSAPRAAADATAFGSNAIGAPGARGQRGVCIHSFSSSSSSSSDDDKRLSRDRGIVGTGPGRRVGISSGGVSGGLDAGAARRRSGSVGGGLMTGGWFELASSNLITAGGAGRNTGGGGGRSTGGAGGRSTGGGGGRGTDGCAGRSTGGGGRSAGGGGQGILHSYTYNISSSSSSTSASHDGEREDTAQQVDAVNNLVGKRTSASPRGVRASDGGGLTATTGIASSPAPVHQESAGMSKLRGQLQRARQSLLRLQLSSGGGGPPLPQDAVGSRRSGPGGLGASQGGMGPNMGAGSGRGVHGGDDRSHDVVKGFPDDDISMLLSALLEGQLSSTQERYSAAAMAAAAATSGGGIRVRFAAEYPNGAATAGMPRDAAHGDEDDDDCEDEPWRIAARPLPPGKLVRLLRALQQLHLRNPQLLRSRRHGRRLWRLLQGVASGDGEAEMLLDAATGGRGAVGAAPMQRRAFNDRSSGGGSAVAALAAAMFGVGGGPTKSFDGDISGNDIRYRAVAPAPAGQRQLRTDRGTALEVKPSAARSLVQWQEASLLAQEAEEQEAWREVARTREVRGLDAAGKMRNYQGMDRTGYSPRSYGGAASVAVAANVPSRPRCSGSASPVSGRRSSSAHASPQATTTSPNRRAHQVAAAAARSNSAGAGRSAASSSAAGSTRTRSTAAVAAARMPGDAQRSPVRLLPVAITAAGAAGRRSSPGSPTVTAAPSRVRRTSEVEELATAVAGGARSRSPTSFGGKGPGSPSPSNQFLQPAGFPSSNDATPADAGTPPSLDKSQSSSRPPAAVWRNSLIAIVGPSAQPDPAEISLVLPQAVAGTVAGRSKSPAKMLTYAPSLALLKPSSNSPGSPWSGGGTAAATMTPEIPFLGARRPVSPTVDMSNTTGNGKGKSQPTLPQQLPPEFAMKARSASPALARSATAVESVEARARQLASAADRSPTVSTTDALERTPAPSIAGASPRHAGVNSYPATAPAAAGAYRTPPVKVSPPRRWRPAGSAPQRVARGAAVVAAHRCTSAVAKATIRDPAALTNAVQELRAAVAARSLSLTLQTNGPSPNQRVRSRPVPTTVTQSRHGQAKNPGHSESPAAPDQQPQRSGKDPTPRVPERRKVAAAAATTTTARVGELFRPMRQENQQQHYTQKRQQPLPPPPSSAPADTLRETSSPMEHSRPPCSVPSSPDTASAATPESDKVLEPQQRMMTQRDGLMHQAGHFWPPFQYPWVDASPSGRLPQALSDMHHRCANGDGVDRESHGLIDSSASSLESPLQGPIRHPGAAEAAIAATGLSNRSGDALQRLQHPGHHPQRQPSSRSPQREYHADSSESLFAVAAVTAAEARPGIGSATFGRWVQPTPAEGQLLLPPDVMPSDILSWQSSLTTRDLGQRRHGAHGVERGGGDQVRAGCAGGGGGSDRNRGGNGGEKRGGDRKDGAGPSGSNGRSGIGGDGGGEDPSDSSDGGGDGDDDMGEASEQAEGEEEDQDNASELSLRSKAVAAASTARGVIPPKPAAAGFPPAAAASRAAAELDTDTQSPRKYRSPPRVRPRSVGQSPERGGGESQFNSDDSHDSNHFSGGAARVHRHHGRSGAGGTRKVTIQARPQPQTRESASPSSPSSPLPSSPLPSTTTAAARAATDAAAASHAAARTKFGSSPSPSPSPSPATAGSSPPSSRVGQRSRPPSPLSASASPSLREADLAARCRELEGQLAKVYREMDELVSRAQGTKGVVSNGADDLRQQLATMGAALAALEAENRELREAVRHSRTTYENAAALAAKMARLQEKVDLLTLDKRELEVQLDLARLSPRSATPGKGTSPRPSPPDTAHQQKHIIEALLEQVAELQQEKAALQEQLTQRAGLQQQQQQRQQLQHQPAYKSARKGYAAATATATASASASAAADSGSTPRTVPRTAPAQVAAYPPPRSQSQSRSPLASPAAANASKVAGKSGSRGDADGVMMARIAQLQRQVRVLTAENDSLRCQGAMARAGPSEQQAQIRNLQGQVQSLGQQLESERWVRSHLNDMQAQTVGPTTARQRQSPPPVSQHTQQQAAPRRSSVSLPPPPQHQAQPHQSRQRQRQQPYGPVAKAIIYGPISSPPSGGKRVADFQVTVEPLGPGRQGQVASPAAREGGPSFMQDGYR